jgi:glycosyltransferase involved in cell wall biosynthesis
MKEVKTVINLVDQLSSVNFGIWHAAIASSSFLWKNHGVRTLIAVPKTDYPFDREGFPHAEPVFLEKTDAKSAVNFFSGFSPEKTLVVSHGTWRFPTQWAAQAKKAGFCWVYTPHGMLEPWSMSQKKWKKWAYFFLKEKPLARQADVVRAVGGPEAENLKKHFARVIRIPNGIYPGDILTNEKPEKPLTFLFLGRLHHKKGVMPLLRAWKKSRLFSNPGFRLLVAGTPDGEEEKVAAWWKENPGSNVDITGPAFGEKKRNLLSQSSFYVLPSLSEGFPTSVVEAMAAGLIPMISEGCNFPEVFSENLGIEVHQDESDLVEKLNRAGALPEEYIRNLSVKNRLYVQENYFWESIAEAQFTLFTSLLNGKAV